MKRPKAADRREEETDEDKADAQRLERFWFHGAG
jgi:hypothetical protein